MKLRLIVFAVAGTCLLQASERIWAQNTFMGGTSQGIPWGPGPATDMTQSLGQFTIVVNPLFQPYLAGVMGYDGSGTYTSPLLYDQSTQISRSMTTQWGSAGWSGGLPVGSAVGPIVSQGSISLTPSAFVPPQAGTDMVFTQISSFNLTNGAVSVTAGTAAMDPNLPNSVGEVISNAGSASMTTPTLDFPARSFFDVFVDITAPNPTGTGTITLTNATVYSGTTAQSAPGTPLVISNSGITSFPPVVIYTHGNSSAVPVYIGSGGIDGLGTDAGYLFGLLTLAGHGAGYGQGNPGTVVKDENTGMDANSTTFSATYTTLTQTSEMPVLPEYYLYPGGPALPPTGSWAPGLTVLPEPSTVSLLVIAGLAAVALRLRRRCRIA